jgi:hypothetical protein
MNTMPAVSYPELVIKYLESCATVTVGNMKISESPGWHTWIEVPYGLFFKLRLMLVVNKLAKTYTQKKWQYEYRQMIANMENR